MNIGDDFNVQQSTGFNCTLYLSHYL